MILANRASKEEADAAVAELKKVHGSLDFSVTPDDNRFQVNLDTKPGTHGVTQSDVTAMRSIAQEAGRGVVETAK